MSNSSAPLTTLPVWLGSPLTQSWLHKNHAQSCQVSNKQQKEAINPWAAKLAIGLWFSWNRSAMLLVSTSADFQVSPFSASSLIFSYFMPSLAPLQSLRWCHPIVAAGWKLSRNGSGVRRVLRPGAASSASPRDSSRLGEPSPVCFHACSPLALAWLYLGYGSHTPTVLFMLQWAPGRLAWPGVGSWNPCRPLLGCPYPFGFSLPPPWMFADYVGLV